MQTKTQVDVECPICDASNPIDDDAKQNDEIFCVYCSSPLRLKKNREDDTLIAVEE